jgi:hypothetical protein
VYSTIQEIHSLLAASRDLLDADEFDVDRLEAWGAERNAIFCRLIEGNTALASADTGIMAPQIHELLELDGKICARIIENKRRLGEQIATARKFCQALSPTTCHAAQLLQRLA